MNTYKKLADMTNVSQPTVQIDGTTMKEIMMKDMEVYENWEKKVCEHLKKYQSELTEGKEHVDYLINDVHEELKHIHLMENDLYDGKYEKLNEWLCKQWGD